MNRDNWGSGHLLADMLGSCAMTGQDLWVGTLPVCLHCTPSHAQQVIDPCMICSPACSQGRRCKWLADQAADAQDVPHAMKSCNVPGHRCHDTTSSCTRSN